MIQESAEAFTAYLKYLRTRVDENGLMYIGLGDWCHTEAHKPMSPLAVTDTVISMDIANKVAFMLDAIGKTAEAEFARGEAALYRAAARANLVDFETMTVEGACQTSQAMALYYGIFDPAEEAAAFARLVEFIHEAGDRMDLGVLGGRVIFHVLAKFGEADLAWRVAVEQGHPSYGDLVRRGATTLWESFYPENAHWGAPSLNHHFWGDISAWFIKAVAGIRFNPTGRDVNRVTFSPNFIASLEHAEAYYDAPAGRITAAWKRVGDAVEITVTLPEGMEADLALTGGWHLSDGATSASVKTGTYRVER
jgi:alpha-L-rhamnosidase